MTLYVYDYGGGLIGRINGDSNLACEAKANEIFGCNDFSWTYTQTNPLEFDDDCQDLAAQ